MKYLYIVFLLAMLLSVTPVFAASLISSDTSPNPKYERNLLVKSSNGTLYAAVMELVGGDRYYIIYNSNDNGTTWNTFFDTSTAMGGDLIFNELSGVMQINSKDVLYLAFISDTGSNIGVISYNTTEGTYIYQNVGSYAEGDAVDMTIDQNDRVTIFYTDTNQDIGWVVSKDGETEAFTNEANIEIGDAEDQLQLYASVDSSQTRHLTYNYYTTENESRKMYVNLTISGVASTPVWLSNHCNSNFWGYSTIDAFNRVHFTCIDVNIPVFTRFLRYYNKTGTFSAYSSSFNIAQLNDTDTSFIPVIFENKYGYLDIFQKRGDNIFKYISLNNGTSWNQPVIAGVNRTNINPLKSRFFAGSVENITSNASYLYTTGIGTYYESYDMSYNEPSVIISSPFGSYSTAVVNLNYTVTTGTYDIDECWYNINNGTNTSLSSCANTSFGDTGNGNFTVYVYANDTLGNIVSDSSQFEIAIAPSPPSEATVTGINAALVALIITILLIAVVYIVYIWLFGSKMEMKPETFAMLFIFIIAAVAMITIVVATVGSLIG